MSTKSLERVVPFEHFAEAPLADLFDELKVVRIDGCHGLCGKCDNTKKLLFKTFPRLRRRRKQAAAVEHKVDAGMQQQRRTGNVHQPPHLQP